MAALAPSASLQRFPLEGAPSLLAGALALLLLGCGGSTLAPEAIAHNTAGTEHLAGGDLDAAEARFHLAVEYHPRFSEPRANLGLVALERGDLDRAERHLRAAIELRADFAEAWGNLGVVLERRRRLDEARAAYGEALSIDPGLVAPRRNLAFLLARTERFPQARAQLMRLAELEPQDAEAQGVLAFCELRLDRVSAALERAERALSISPDEPSARVVRGTVRFRQGALEAAAQDLAVAADHPFFGRPARVRLAALEAVRGHTAQAQSLVRGLLEEDAPDASVHVVAATLALETDDPAGARDHALAALRARPDLPAARALLARACQEAPAPGC